MSRFNCAENMLNMSNMDSNFPSRIHISIFVASVAVQKKKKVKCDM